MDTASKKMGPCPNCLGFIKPCRCQIQAELEQLQADLRKLRDVWEIHDRTVKDSHVGYWRRCCKGRRLELDKLLEGE